MKKNKDELITKADRRSIKRRKAAEFKTDNRKSIHTISKLAKRIK